MLRNLFLLLFSIPVLAATPELSLQTRIVHLSYGHAPQQSILVFTEDGRVSKLSPSQKSFRDVQAQLEAAMKDQIPVELDLDSNRYIQTVIPDTADEVITADPVPSDSVDPSPLPSPVAEATPLPFPELHPYLPTILPDIDAAADILKGLNATYHKDSQCFNRAEVWAFEEFKRRNLYSMKVFMFYTDKFIREFDYDWWFHVAPFVLVNENGKLVERVVDRVFVKKPSLIRDWTDHFIKPKVECPVVQRYSDYWFHQEDQYCYLMKAPMYFWEPADLEGLEQGIPAKTEFVQSDVDQAYQTDFGPVAPSPSPVMSR